MHKNEQVYLQGQFLHAGIVGKKLNLVAMFATLQMEFNHKIFYSNKKTIDRIAKICGFKANRAYTLIRECVEWGIIVELNDKKGGHRLLSNLELSEKFGGSKFTKAYLTHEVLNMGIKAAVTVLRQIPNLSCAKAQLKRYERNLNRISKSDARVGDVLENLGTVINGERIYTIDESKLKRKLDGIGLDNPLSDPTASISIKTGAKNSGVSAKTFIKDKRFLHSAGVCCVTHRYRELQGDVSAEQWETIKKEKSKHKLPHYARYNRGAKTIYRNLACGFSFPKHA